MNIDSIIETIRDKNVDLPSRMDWLVEIVEHYRNASEGEREEIRGKLEENNIKLKHVGSGIYLISDGLFEFVFYNGKIDTIQQSKDPILGIESTIEKLGGKITPEVKREIVKYVLGLEEEEKREEKEGLSEGDKELIVSTLKEYYTPDTRKDLILSLLYALARNNIPLETAKEIVEEIIEGDFNKDEMLSLVERFYKDNLVEVIKPRKRLRDIINKELSKRDTSEREDDILNESLIALSTLNKVLHTFIEDKELVKEIQAGEVNKYYANDPRRGILLLSKSGKSWKKEVILDYYIEKVIVYVNPEDKNDMVYTLSLRNPRTGRVLTYQEDVISNIVSNLENTKAGVSNPTKLKASLSSLISEFLDNGLAEVKHKIPATGFFLIDGELIHYETPRFKVRDLGVDKEKVKEMLEVLDKDILGFYRHNDRALKTLYFGIQAPLGYIRKRHYGKENKLNIDYGEPHVGKTWLNRIIGYLWGLDEGQVIIGGSRLTAPQLAEFMDRTTYMITIDEAKNPLIDPGLADMIKNSTILEKIKYRINPSQGYTTREFHAYASLSLTLNSIPPALYSGIEDRLIPGAWTHDDRRSEEEVEEFERKITEYREELAYIGSYLRDLYKRRWSEVREILKESDQIEVGRKLLELLYEDLGIPKPEWLKPIEVKYDIETPTPEELFFNTIREDLHKKIMEARHIVEVSKETLATDRIDLTIEDWKTRIIKLGEAGYLPGYILLGKRKKHVFITSGVIDAIRRKTGYELPGGLSNLALKLGYKYDSRKTNHQSLRVMIIPIDDLAEKLSQVVEVEEEE